MDRRDLIKSALWGGALLVFGQGQALAAIKNPTQVDEKLWRGINTAADPANPVGLEKLHSPVITAPGKVKAGEVFPVEVAVGQTPHPMGPKHWIEYLQFNIGNEPAEEISFRSYGWVKAAGTFHAVLDEPLKGKTISLVVQLKCNLHGLWQNSVDVMVA